MEDLFNMLLSSARLDKSKRKKKPTASAVRQSAARTMEQIKRSSRDRDRDDDDDDDDDNDDDSIGGNDINGDDDDRPPKKKRPKKQHSAKKLAQIRREEMSAFRRRMGIRLSNDNRHEVTLGTIPDAISSFREWKRPTWWGGGGTDNNNHRTGKKDDGANDNGGNDATRLFDGIHRTVLANIENGKWPEPTPIQMQAVPSLG